MQIPLTVTGGGSGNPVVLTLDPISTGAGTLAGTTLSVAGTGNFVIDANQAGATNYDPAPQVKRTIVVSAFKAQAITFSQPGSPVKYSTGLTISLSARGGSSGNPVVFNVDGASTGSGSIAGGLLSVTGAGTLVIDANQAGSSTYSAAPQLQRTIQVNPGVQVITFPQPATPVTFSSGLTVSLSATGGDSGNPVMFTLDPGSIGAGTIVGNTLTVSSPGAYIINANQAGDSNYVAAAPLTREVDVNSSTSQVTVTPTTVSFGSVVIGQASSNPIVVLKNTGSAITINAIAVSPSVYAATAASTCAVGATLATNAFCKIVLSATNAGTVGPLPLGALTVTTTATDADISVPLTANGYQPMSAWPPSIAFGNVVVQQASAIETVTVTNRQRAGALNISSITLPAGGYAFDPSSTCPNPGVLPAKESCVVAIALTPTATGPIAAGSIVVASDAANTPVSVGLSGKGIPATNLSPTTLAFGQVATGGSSTMMLTIANNSTGPLALSGAVFTGPFAIDTGASPASECPLIGGALSGNLAGGTKCVLPIKLSPTTTGNVTGGAVTVNSSDPAGPASASLTGAGVPATQILPATLAFGNVVENTTSPTQTLIFTNSQTIPLSFTSISAPVPYSITSGANSCTVGTPVAAGGTCSIYVNLTPTSTGVIPANNAAVVDNANIGPQTLSVALTGAGVLSTTISPSQIAFGNAILNATSLTKVFTLTNNSPSPLSLTGDVFNGPFALDTTSVIPGGCPLAGGQLSGSLAGGKSCVIGVIFQPTSLGATVNGKFTVLDGDPSGPVSALLSGTGIAPTTLSPASLAFGNVAQNTTSASKIATLTNNLSAPLTMSSISASTPFAVTTGANACSTSTPLAPKSSCPIYLTFSPTALGAAPTATLAVNDNASAGATSLSINLTGAGVPPVSLSPSSTLGFGTVVVGVPTTKILTLTNNQPGPLSISSITGLTGVFAVNTAQTTCPYPSGAVPGIPTGNSCVIAVDLTATATGVQSQILAINDDGPGSPHSVTMTGSAKQQVILAPPSLYFPSQFVGTTSAAKTITLNNDLTRALTIASVTLSGTSASEFNVSTTCPTSPATLPASGTCALQVTFSPIASGTRTATLTVSDDASNKQQTVSLSGAGSAPVLVTPSSITNFTAKVGTTSAYQTITVKNAQTAANVNISNFNLSGDFVQTSTSCGAAYPYVLVPGASCNLTVSFDPTISGTRTGQLQVFEIGTVSPQVVNLSGIGTAPLTVAPASLNFSAQTVALSSPPKPITLTNNENQSEHFDLVASGDYSVTSMCPSGTILAHSSCNLFVTFTPTSVTPSTRTGALTITHSAAIGSPISVPLTGSAISTLPQPMVAVVSPGAGSAGATVNVVITGNGWTHFVGSSATPAASSVISFVDTDSKTYPADITVQSFTAVSANEIDATLVLGTPATNSAYGARNITIKSPLSGGKTESALLLSAFIISDPSSSHQIIDVTPAFGTQGQPFSNIAITAQGTHFVRDVTFANFGDGVTVNALTITSPTTAVATISISNTTPVGYRTITLVTGGEFAVSVPGPDNNPIFHIGPNSAVLTGISPSTALQGWSGPVTVTATGTHFLPNATQVSIPGTIVGDVNYVSATQVTAQVAVPAGAPIGTQSVTVSTGGEIASLANAFTITGSTPGLVSVVPSSANQGDSTTVVITGNTYTDFTTCPGGSVTANFSGSISNGVVTVDPVNHNQVSVPITVSQNAPVGTITANLTCGTSGSATLFPFGFTVTPSGARISNVVPSNVPQGGQLQLTVTGSGTHWVQGTTTANFYPTSVPTPSFSMVTINSPTSATLNISVPTNSPVGDYGFYMSTGGEVVSSSVHVYANTPTLTMNPANGLVPTGGTTSRTVNFTGQFTSFGKSTVPVIAGEGVILTSFKVISGASATATLNILPGAATGLRLVTFTTGSEIVTTYFNVTTTPVGIISVTPPHAAQSATLDVEITGLNTHWTPASTQVQFGPQITVSSFVVNGPTDITANITTSYMNGSVLTQTPSGYQNVYVNTGAEQVIGGFSVDPPATPVIISVSPNSAQQGSTDTPITITGSLTNWVKNTSELILGAGVTVANLTITGPTTATATLSVSPTAPVGGNSVIMITGSEIDSGVGFSVTPSAALIQSVEPNFICPRDTGVTVSSICPTPGAPPSGTPVVAQLQTSTLNIVGVGTHWLQGETTISFGSGVNIDVLTVSDPTHAQAEITVLSSAPVGFAPLTTYTDGETVTLQQAIDIEEGSPKLLAISPSAGQQGATFTMQILGRFTHWQNGVSQVTFNNPDLSIVPSSINVIDSENMTVGVTVSPLAYVDYSSPCGHDVTVTTGSEQVSTDPVNDPFCVQQGAEEITGLSPLAGIQGSTLVLTVTGSATHFTAGITQVAFDDAGFQVGQITVTSPTSLSVPVGLSTTTTTGYKNVTVSTLGEVARQQFSFTITPGVATLNEAIPNQAEQGAPLSGQPPLVVRLMGQYSHFSSSTTATFGPGITVQSVAYVSSTEVDATINIDPLSYVGGRNVTVNTPGVSCAFQPPVNAYTSGVVYTGCTAGVSSGTGNEIVNANIFTIITGPAIITNVTPATGNEGQEVAFNLNGLDTHWQQNFTQFYIAGGGSDITVNSVVINSATSATIDINIAQAANPGPRSIFMVTNGESLTDSGAFVVTGGIPVVTSVSPNSALKGTTGLEVTINGNAYTQWDSTSKIGFGPGITVSSFQVDDASHIEAVLNIDPNAQVGYRTVTVQTGTQVLTGYFQVTAPAPPPTPYIWYENPSSGIPGQTLTISFNGAYTHWDPDPISGTQLTGFDSNVVINSFQVTSPTTALANITIAPDAVQAYYTLSLTTNTVSPSEVDYAGFTVVVARPTLSVVDPGSAMQGAKDVTVNIIGQFTNFDATTTFAFGSGITVNGPPTILGPTIATQSISVGIETPTGGYPVVATTTDVPSAQQVVGGAGFSVTPSLARIVDVSPNTALQGGTIPVQVTGDNTHWAANTVFNFGAGIVVTSTNVTSNTTASLTLAIPPLASIGPTWVSATTSGEVASITNGFVVQVGTPLLLSSGPWSVSQQGNAIFTILSQATSWTNTAPPVVSYGPGVVITNVNVTSPTSMTVDGYVQPTTPVGYRNLTVTTGTQVLNLYNAFYVSPGPAVINNVVANSAGQGATLTVTVNGTNTNWQSGITNLSFPGATITTLNVTSPTTIVADITISAYASAGQVTLTATTAGETAIGVNVFTITQTQPELLSVVSSSGMQGQTETVTLTGAFTHFTTAQSVPSFGAGVTVNSANAPTPTSLQVNLTVEPTAMLGARNVSVTTTTITSPEVVNLNNAFNVTAGPAAIHSLSLGGGGQGNSYTIVVTGSQAHFQTGVTTASFGGGIVVTNITVTDLLHATVNIQIPSSTALGSYDVSLHTGGETATILGAFTVTTGTPQISQVSPPTGAQGSSHFSVQLTGLFTHFVNGVTTANFGSGITVNSVNVTGSTQATADITISATAAQGNRDVTVTTVPETASITGGFTVLAGVPTLTQAAPGTAQAGTTDNIVITGAFTTFQQGFVNVSMGTGVTVNFIQVTGLTQLTANITVASNAPVGARDISVTANGQTLTMSGALTVTAGTPFITQISPNIGTPGQSIPVTITGQYTNWLNGTTVASFGGGITVSSTVVSSATSLIANIVIPSGASVGPVDVSTSTLGENEGTPGGFTIQAASIPAPYLISFSPSPNAGGIPVNSNFTVVFSQPMNRTTINSSNVIFYLASNPSGWAQIPLNISVDASGRVLTLTTSGLLAANAQYYLHLTSGIKDATGNSFGDWAQYFYTAFTANTTLVSVIATNPMANATGIGTNVPIQLEFNSNMNESTQAGMIVMAGVNPVPGSYSWNGNPYCCTWGPGTVLTFTPTSPLQANTVYTVSYNNSLSDTADNAVVPGSFTFTTGAGADTSQNYAGPDFANYISNVALNFAPTVNFSKPINPIDINTGTMMLYNADSGKYVAGAVTVAPNGMSATFKPTYPLLPDTYYYVHLAWGYYDGDGNYLNGTNSYFTTGTTNDMTVPTVASVSPADGQSSIPLNSVVRVHFNEPIDPDTINNNTVTLTPTGGGALVSGTATLAGDLVTLTFTPTTSGGTFETGLQPATQYTVNVSGFSDLAGNPGNSFSSSFTTMTTVAPLSLSTGFDASGNLITTGGTPDAHWTVIPGGSTTPQAADVVAPGQGGWSSYWSSYGYADGPNSSVITVNPNAAQGYPNSTYTTSFDLTGYSLDNLCLVGSVQGDPYGTLMLNGLAITNTNQFYPWEGMATINIALQASSLNAGANSLSYQLASGWDGYEGFRLQANIQTCGASLVGGLLMTSSIPASGTSNVATDTTVTMNFNHPIDPATVNSSTLPIMVGWNSNAEIAGSYVVTGNQVVFTPAAPFPTDSQIYMGACNGPLDLAGEGLGNCYTQLGYFYTGGTAVAAGAPFKVIAFTPANNATNIGLRAPVAATFNRSVNLNSVNSSDFGLFAGDSQYPWCTSMAHSQDDATIAFNCYALPSGTPLTAVLGSGISDWQGNGLATYTSQFTTTGWDSNTNGSVTGSRPGNGASGVNLNAPLTLFFNLPIDPNTATNGIEVAQNNLAIPGSVQVLDNGYVLAFTPSTPFTPGALVQWWTTGTLFESTYDTVVSGASGYFYVASNTDALAPSIQVISPSNGSSYIPLNSTWDVQFNTALNPATVNSNNIYLYDSSTGLHVNANYTTPQPNEVRLVPTTSLTANAYIYLYVTTGLQSATSVPAAATNYYAYTGTTNDNTIPIIMSAVPYNGATNVGINADPGVVFNKTIDPVSINSNTFQVTQGSNPISGTFWLSSGNSRAQFVPNEALPASSTLTMKLNGVLDIEGNPINFTSSFQTGAGPDYSSPYVVSSSIPSNGSVPTNSNITVQFSESMDVTTFSIGSAGNCGNIRIYDTLGNWTCIGATLSWSADQSMAYIVPSAPLAAGRQYYLSVNGGTDLAGNGVNGYNIYFYGELQSASSAPTVINFNPLPNASGLGTNAIIEAQFSGPIDPTTIGNVMLTTGGSTVNTSPSVGSGNTVLQLVPNVPLAANTTYVMTIAGVKDPAGNPVATFTNTFTTGTTYDLLGPSAVNSDPANNNTVGTNVHPKLLFNKPLNPITVSNSTFRMYLYDTGQWIPLAVTPSPDGLTVTMVPQVALQPNTRYHFQVCCSYQDQNGNNGNGSDIYFWTSGGAVTAPPTVSVSPANGAIGTPLNAQVIASVSAPVDPLSVKQNAIQVYDASNNPVAGTVSLANVQQINFAPAAPLVASTTYTVTVDHFTDANGNPVAPYNGSFHTGAAAVTSGFSVSSTDPGWGASNVNENQVITVTFNQNLDPATLSTLMVMNGWNSNYPLAGTWALSAPNQIQFTPSSPYPPGAQVYVGSCGGPTDILGEVFNNGTCWTQIVNFNVNAASPDTTALTVLSVSPAPGSTNVQPDTPVSVTFNKGINPYTAYNSSNALLYAGQGLQDRSSFNISSDGRTLTFNTGTLSCNTTYTVYLPAGGISDPSGNALATTYSSTFNTGCNPATGNGSVVGTSPSGGASGVSADTLLTLYVNRPVDPSAIPGNLTVTVNGQVYSGSVLAIADGYEVQYTPGAPFPAGATVQWFFSGMYDTYGNPVNGTSNSFYIAPTAHPTTDQPIILGISPSCCGSSLVPTNAQIDIQYSLPIDPTTVTGNVYENSGPGSAFSVSVPAGLPNIVRISPPASGWTPSTWYGFCTNSSIKGTNGVNAPNSCWLTYFTTTTGPDSSAGTISVGPPNNVINVGTNAYLRFQFSKPVDRSTVNSTNIQISTGGVSIPGSWSYSQSGGDVWGANFSPLNPLPASSVISISTNNILDYAGNLFTPATSQFTTAALPDYTTPTVSMDFSWWQSGVATNASFSCRYSEAMDPSSVYDGNTYLRGDVEGHHIPVSHNWSSDMMSLTMTPVNQLFANSYYYYYCQGGIDLTGNGQNGDSRGFTTGAGTSSAGPVLVQTNPPNGMTNVPLNNTGGPWSSVLLLQFNEPVSQSSVGNITLTPQGGSPIPIAVNTAWNSATSTIAVVQLPWALAPNTAYTYNIAGVTDINGNAAAPATSSFTTGTSFDWNNPGITSVLPANGATDVGVSGATISVTFSEAMNLVFIDTNHIYLRTHNTQTTVPASLTFSSDFTTVTLTPTSPLDPNTIYDLIVTNPNWCMTDVAGNNFNNCGWQVVTTFTTGSATATNGVCGSANGMSFAAPPATNLCSAGTVSGQTNNGTYSWTCSGANGGTNASCSATITPANACYAQSTLSPASLAGWWKGDDSPVDQTGNGNDGTLENGAAYALGLDNDGFTFNGNNQYVLIGQPVPNNLQIQSAITLQAWIYVTQYPVDNGSGALGLIVGSQHDGTTAGATIFYDGRTNSDGSTGSPPGHISFNIGGDGYWHVTDSLSQVPMNQWVLVTATRSANNAGKIYYDGVLQPSTTAYQSQWNGDISYTGAWFAIGQQSDYNRAFNGLIDEAQVFNGELTAAQVQAIYQAGNAGVCP